MGQHRRPAGADARASLKRSIACAREAVTQRTHNFEGASVSCAWPRAAFGVPGESALVADIVQALEQGPCEVSSMSSRLAKRFNETVRKSALTPFTPDGKNDGSFKDWLIQCGFVIDPPHDRNKRLLHLPAILTESLPARQEDCVEAPPPKSVSSTVSSQRRDERIWKKKEESCEHSSQSVDAEFSTLSYWKLGLEARGMEDSLPGHEQGSVKGASSAAASEVASAASARETPRGPEEESLEKASSSCAVEVAAISEEEPHTEHAVDSAEDSSSDQEALKVAEGSVEEALPQQHGDSIRDSDPACSVQQEVEITSVTTSRQSEDQNEEAGGERWIMNEECANVMTGSFGDEQELTKNVEAVEATAEDNDISSTWTLADVPEDSEEAWVIVP
mmetsp:Transcript_89711/g.168940  ORF Transcript_89711/g.168940 Transcript_89711/m.168940 type:complete len:391 (-) Transcript_89711:7-1179(-)